MLTVASHPGFLEKTFQSRLSSFEKQLKQKFLNYISTHKPPAKYEVENHYPHDSIEVFKKAKADEVIGDVQLIAIQYPDYYYNLLASVGLDDQTLKFLDQLSNTQAQEAPTANHRCGYSLAAYDKGNEDENKSNAGILPPVSKNPVTFGR